MARLSLRAAGTGVAALLLVAVVAPPAFPPSSDSAAASPVPNLMAQLPLSFEENQGQFEPDVRFATRPGRYRVAIKATSAVVSVSSRAAQATTATLQISFVGGDPAVVPVGVDRLPGKINYLLGNDPARWRRSVPTYAGVKVAGVYPGVDLVYHGRGQDLEYDFVLSPGADAGVIRVAFDGAHALRLASDGRLVARTAAGEIVQPAPVAYQEAGGRRHHVPVGYVLSGDEVNFQLGSYDPSRPLVIDPVVGYLTYLGGEDFDSASSIAVDQSGAVYVTGQTFSPGMATTDAAQDEIGKNEFGSITDDAFVAKLSPDGSSLVYATYLGGDGSDQGRAIAVDAAGAAHVTGGTSSTNFPRERAFQSQNGRGEGFDDAFIVKLDPDGSRLQYGTYLGGEDFDEGTGIAVDEAGVCYVTGNTSSNGLATPNAFQGTAPGGLDAFVVRIAVDGTPPSYATYLGGSELDNASGIAVDRSGTAAYVTGETSSLDFPHGAAHQGELGGGSGGFDAYVVKLGFDGSPPVYARYLGGTEFDVGLSVAVDGRGAAYVAGGTLSTDFPSPVATVQRTHGGGGADGFVTKFTPAGAIAYSSYLGGRGFDFVQAITVDDSGNAYVAGSTGSANFPTVRRSQGPAGGGDVFVSKVAPDGSRLIFSTYLGGMGSDGGTAIAVGRSEHVHVAGITFSDGLATPNAFQRERGGGEDFPSQDAFVAMLANQAPAASDDFASTTPDVRIIVAAPGVLENDSDPDGDTLTASVLTQPAHGTVDFGADGAFTYTPATGFRGLDAFSYTARDTGGAESGAASVSISIAPEDEGGVTTFGDPTPPGLSVNPEPVSDPSRRPATVPPVAPTGLLPVTGDELAFLAAFGMTLFVLGLAALGSARQVAPSTLATRGRRTR